MIYKFYCNLCKSSNKFDVEQFDIDDAIKFSVNNDDDEISYLCEACQKKIYDICGVINFEKKIDALTKNIQAHSIGMQNVYDLFNKLTDATFISGFEHSKKQLFDEIKKIKKEVIECREFMEKGYKKMTVINDIYSLTNSNDKLIGKIAALNKIFNYYDEEDS